MKATNRLSDLICQRASPRLKLYRLTDGHGLCLLITPRGSKHWQWRYRFEEKAKLMALGKYPNISLMEARVLHAKARTLLATGVDPIAKRKSEKLRKRAEFREEKKISILAAAMLAQEKLASQLLNSSSRAYEKLMNELLVTSSRNFENMAHKILAESNLAFKNLTHNLSVLNRAAFEKQIQELLALGIDLKTIRKETGK